MALKPSKLFAVRAPDLPKWLGTGVPEYSYADLRKPVDCFVAVRLDYDALKKRDLESLDRIEAWLKAYDRFFEGAVTLDLSEGYVVRFARLADADTFWHHCIRNPFTYGHIRDVFVHQ